MFFVFMLFLFYPEPLPQLCNNRLHKSLPERLSWIRIF